MFLSNFFYLGCPLMRSCNGIQGLGQGNTLSMWKKDEVVYFETPRRRDTLLHQEEGTDCKVVFNIYKSLHSDLLLLYEGFFG